MFRERERFTKHRLRVMGADGVDLKPMLDKNSWSMKAIGVNRIPAEGASDRWNIGPNAQII